MNDKTFILNIAKNQLEKDLNKAQKQVDKHSQKLANVDMENTTVRNRANLRINLDIACEDRDNIQRRLDVIEEWKKEVGR